jgi:hypothetical protein
MNELAEAATKSNFATSGYTVGGKSSLHVVDAVGSVRNRLAPAD